MKVLEAQSAALSNHEVYGFLKQQANDYDRVGRRGPKELQVMRKELMQYFENHPSPLSQKPATYQDKCTLQLVRRLRQYDITKGEMLMILNLRPTSVINLNAVLDDMETRFDENKQQDIIKIIVEVLGSFEGAERGDTMDTSAA